MKAKIERDEKGKDRIIHLNSKGKITGSIVSFAVDKEHSRMLYVISKNEDDKASFWGFTHG